MSGPSEPKRKPKDPGGQQPTAKSPFWYMWLVVGGTVFVIGWLVWTFWFSTPIPT